MEAFSISPALLPITVLLCALAAKYCYQLTTSSQSTFFAFYCQQLANKVNRQQNSVRQQAIAGWLATLLTLSPIIVILWLFEAFVDVTFIWHFLLVFVSLGNLRLSYSVTQIGKQLNQNANYQAKETLAPLVLRDTSKLSSMGIAKSSIEMQLLATLQQIYTVVFWYLVLGPLAAVAYRMLLEMHYSWNRKLPRFQYFGCSAEFLVNVFCWLPTRLSFITYFLTHLTPHSATHWQLTRRAFFSLGNSANLSLVALVNNIKLGGVAMYENEKLRRKEFNVQGQQPAAKDLFKLNKQLNWHSLTLFVLVSFLFIVFNLSY